MNRTGRRKGVVDAESFDALFDPALALEMWHARFALGSADRAEHEVRNTRTRGGIRDRDPGRRLLLGAARERGGHRERGIHAIEEAVERWWIRQVADGQFDAPIGECLRGRLARITHERTHPRTAREERVDDGAALIAGRADDGDQR